MALTIIFIVGVAVVHLLVVPTNLGANTTIIGNVLTLLGGALATMSQGDLLTEVLLYKVVAALAHIAGAALIFWIALRLGAHRDQARASASSAPSTALAQLRRSALMKNSGAITTTGKRAGAGVIPRTAAIEASSQASMPASGIPFDLRKAT